MWWVLISALMLLPVSAPAMDLKVLGRQLILTGPVVGDEPAKVAEALAKSPEIDTVILRNSPGGNAPAGYQVGQLLREHGLRTAVSGYCYSSCSRMFMGGRARYFTDDYPSEYTNIGFHGHYYLNGKLNTDLVRQLDLRGWIIRYSDGKADPRLVERWINIPYSRGMIHFFHPLLVKRDGASTFMCQGDEPSRLVFACEAVGETALDLGIVTSLDIEHSADQGETRPTIGDR